MKKTQTLLAIIFILIALFSGLSGHLQTITKDSNGNFIQVKDKHTDSVRAVETGHTFTTYNGEVLKIYQSERGKLFVYRVAKSGHPYKSYLKLD